MRYPLDLAGGVHGAIAAFGMSGAAFLRIKKLKGSGIITVAARHNKREIQAERGATGTMDPTRSRLNYALAGPAAAGNVGQLAKDLMTAAGVVKLRKDAVMGLEIVFSLPPDTAIDDRAYFTACVAWAGLAFGGAQNILSADVHRDEAAPHCHVLLLPLIDGRMDGSNLLGNKQKLMALQKDFHAAVASKFGLSKAPARLAGMAKQAGAKKVLQHLRDTADPVLKSPGWPTYRDAIEAAPASFLLAYGLELALPKKKLRTFTQIMTSKGKGPAKEPNPIGFTASQKRQTLCSVGFTPKTPPLPALKPAHQQAQVIENRVAHDQPSISTFHAVSEIALPVRHYMPNDMNVVDAPFVETTTREKETDLDPARFHDGEYCPQPPPAPRRHKQACDAALMALNDYRVRQDISFSVGANS